MAGTLLKQNIEKNSDDIINKEKKFNEKSRFCHLQSSSSSSSEKDMAFGQKKKYMIKSVDHDVPEEATQEDQKSCGNDDIEIEAINITGKENLAMHKEETSGSNNSEFANSLFTFNFLNEENPRPFAGRPNPEQENYKQFGNPTQMDSASTQNTASNQIPGLEIKNRSPIANEEPGNSAIGYISYVPEPGNNYHNFFTNDSIFTSPSPFILYSG